MNRFKEFFTKFLPEVAAEMRKTSFPSRPEVVGTTGVVLITSVIFAVYLWVVDLAGDRLIVHRKPTANGYADVRSVARGETISPLAFPDVTSTADEILG